jgi:site-specific DNA-methyltransferase (adenine-specific)
VNYRDRSGRSIQNDANADWLKPAMREAYRVLKPNRVAVMFYGWTKVDAFFEAWKLPFPARRTYRLSQIV